MYKITLFGDVNHSNIIDLFNIHIKKYRTKARKEFCSVSGEIVSCVLSLNFTSKVDPVCPGYSKPGSKNGFVDVEGVGTDPDPTRHGVRTRGPECPPGLAGTRVGSSTETTGSRNSSRRPTRGVRETGLRGKGIASPSPTRTAKASPKTGSKTDLTKFRKRGPSFGTNEDSRRRGVTPSAIL